MGPDRPPSTQRRRPANPSGVLVVMAVLVVLTAAPPAMAVLVDGVTVTGTVTGPGDVPLEGVRVLVVGMEEFNATTGSDGGYLVVVPPDEDGLTLRFSHIDHQTRDEITGPLEPNGFVNLNSSLQTKPPLAFLYIRILPWDQPGSNYGLRQDVMTIVNASGTPPFQWSEKSSEEEAAVPAPGAYLVTATRPGYYPLSVAVTVERGDRLTVDLDLSDRKKPTFGTVNGTVVHNGQPLANATVVAEPEEGTRTYNAITDEGGLFILQLPNGTYNIIVKAEGYATLSEGVLVDLGVTRDMHFPMSIAQETGDEGDPMLAWLALGAAVAALAGVMAFAISSSRRTALAKAEAEARDEELACPACGATAPADADRCAHCDAPFPWKSFRCPDCGAVMELDATRCPECGNQTFDLHRG